MKLKLLLTFSSLLFFAYTASSQIKIKGCIKDEATQLPLELVNVTLLQNDSVFIKGTISDNKGNFVIDKVLQDGNYIISVSYLGYENIIINLHNLNQDLNIGDIHLPASSVLLDGVTVTAQSVIKKSDRQIILPTQAQIKASNNGLTLLKNLQLARISINPLTNSVQMPDGANVQLRINGVEVSQAEMIALLPSEIIRIEYIDNPGMQYGNAGAVLNYITRRKESGGSIGADLANSLVNWGWGENYASGKYNHRNSEWSTNIYWGRRNLEWTRENYETFVLPSETLIRKEIGEPTKVKFDNLNISLNYNLQKTDKHLLNVRLKNSRNNTPNAEGDRASKLYEGNNVLSIYDHSSSASNTPSLDVYYQQELKNKQLLIVNVVGTYIDSKNTRTYQESRENNMLTNVYSHIIGDKYSLIGEAIYIKQLSKGKLTGGIKHTQAYASNKYTGNTVANVGMNIAETYAYLEYQFAHKKLNYTFGLGEMRTYNRQGDENLEKYILRPKVSISYNVTDNLFLRYNAFISGYAPSLSELNNVEQQIDSLQFRRGNTSLKTVRFYSNDLTAGWNKEIFGVELFARYSYDVKPVMGSIFEENGKFIQTYNNQKGFHRINIQTSFKLQPLGEHIYLTATPFVNRYISLGSNYTHAKTNWGFKGSVMGQYKQWTVTAEMSTSYNNLWGETYSKGERFHTIMIGYNTERWSLFGGVFYPFSEKYELETQNLSALAPNRQLTYSDKFGRMLVINASFNFNFGRTYNTKGKKLNNEDTDSGILSGKK